jgi:NADH-ubiquinone oxidoreductase chain 2
MRLTAVAMLFAACLALNCYSPATLGCGVSLFSGLFSADAVTTAADAFICIAASLALMPWPAICKAVKSPIYVTGPGLQQKLAGTMLNTTQTVHSNAIAEYAMLALFSTTGSLMLLAAADVVSMYLAIELQSFAVYVLAATYRNNEAATAAGLKYFLLGALSSAIILLGTAMLYKHTGLTNLHAIANLLAVQWSQDCLLTSGVGTMLGLVLIGVGLLFKVGAAPLHNWAPDVYNSVPTVVTTWLAVMPKIAVFMLLLNVCLMVASSAVSSLDVSQAAINAWQLLLLVSAVLSLVIGTVLGLAQRHIKRLLAYSTVSHVGFMLVALACACYSYTGVEAVSAMLFYLSQYTLTGLAAFFVLLGFGYVLKGQPGTGLNERGDASDVALISTLAGHATTQPMLALSMLVCLFSMAGVPPMVGFFAKYNVLYVAMLNGHYAIALLGVVTSVISAAYYLRVVRVLYFDPVMTGTVPQSTGLTSLHPGAGVQVTGPAGQHTSLAIGSLHSYAIACLTMFMLLFMLQPAIMLNSTQLLAMTQFTG